MARTPQRDLMDVRGAPANQGPATQAAFVTPHLALANQTISGRWHRRPQHTFQLRSRPYDIQPFCIAPVLPGESLTNLQLQARVVSDPISNPLVGWWKEYYFFYVKHTDMEASAAAITAMHLQNTSLGLADANAREHNYKFGTDSVVDWVHQCMLAIIPHYFRDSDEPLDGWNNAGVRNTTLYQARVADLKWLDSLKIEDVNPTMDSDLPGQVTQLPPHMSAFATHYDQWTFMRELKQTDLSFEDYLATFGIKVPREDKEEIRKPELIRYIKDFTYPANTVDPETGVPSSALSWAIAERGDKRMFFQSPGFIIGLTVTRPKVYFRNQIRNAATMLDDAFGWLPAVMREDPYTSLIEYDHNEGPLSGVFNAADDYWVDRRDVFLYGDQFINYDARDTDGAGSDALDLTFATVDLPKSSGDNNLNKWYAASTDVDNLFKNTDAGVSKVREDGIVTLDILGKQADHT